MLDLRLILLLIFFVVGCSDMQEKTSDSFVTKKTETALEICEVPALEVVSQKFLDALTAKNLATAQSLYFPNSLSNGDDYGVQYTFFPNNDDFAFFDFVKKNAESPFSTYIFGKYDDGYLVTYIQEQHKDLARDPDFLTYRKFDGFFACFFQCIEGEWKITKYTCFEDSGGPFFLPEESNLEE